jgi:hypothetical protein
MHGLAVGKKWIQRVPRIIPNLMRSLSTKLSTVHVHVVSLN